MGSTITISNHIVFVGIVFCLFCCSGSVVSNFTNGPIIQGDHDMEKAACGRSPAQLLPCLPAVIGAGMKPSKSCCSVLKDWGFDCLCNLLKDYQSRIPSNVNKTRALEMPEACGIPVPAGMKCSELGPEPPAHTLTIPEGEIP